MSVGPWYGYTHVNNAPVVCSVACWFQRYRLCLWVLYCMRHCNASCPLSHPCQD